MSGMFVEDDDALEIEVEVEADFNADDSEELDIDVQNENSNLDARRRLENMLEDRRLKAELDDDFDDY
ncbi:MAG: hypothetical protein LCH30_03835 [Proteobacteria bacterium]|nr:hypothetical protein [Pseudomonadota bacterium]